MSDRADFLAGIAASGCGSLYGIESDGFGSFNAPYPDPSPPGGFHGRLDHAMSDDDLVSCDETFDCDDPSKATKPSKSKKQKSNKKKEKKKKKALKKKQGEKMKRIIQASDHLSEKSKQNLRRIAREARAKFGESVEKKTEHLEWAAKTLNTAGYAHYINLVGVDKESQHDLILLQHKEKANQSSNLLTK